MQHCRKNIAVLSVYYNAFFEYVKENLEYLYNLVKIYILLFKSSKLLTIISIINIKISKIDLELLSKAYI